MPEAQLELTIPEVVWVGTLTRAYPEATVRVLANIPDDSTGVGLVEIESEDLSALLADMREAEDIAEMEVLNETGEMALVQFETDNPLLMLAARRSGVPLNLPFEIRDGNAVWRLTASSDRLSELSDQLEAFGVPFAIESLQYDISTADLLTTSQRETIERALELGYYDTPRECTLTELADDLGRAKSTISETLHRAEGKVIREFVEREGAEHT